MKSEEKFCEILGKNCRDFDFSELEQDLKQAEFKTAQDIITAYCDFFPQRVPRNTIHNMPIYLQESYRFELYKKYFWEKFREVITQAEYEKSLEWKFQQVNMVKCLCDIKYQPGEFVVESSNLWNDELFNIADNDETILITGESGTGKEIYAKIIHYISPRGNKEFVAFNCTGVPDTLIESELFGYEKGSHATATKKKIGLLEFVENGTLFLDEIGDMSNNMQAKLLRVLENKEYRTLGGLKTKYFNGRFISATNKNLQEEIKKNPPTFREDLYYRINVMSLELLPLRDIIHELLILDCLSKIIATIGIDSSREYDSPSYTLFALNPKNKLISIEALEELNNYNYPGNFRELNNILKQAYLLSKGKVRIDKDGESHSGRIELENLPDNVRNYIKPSIDYHSITEEKFLRDLYKRRLDFFNSNMSKTAESLGIKYRTFQSRIRNKYPDLLPSKKVNRQ